MTTREEFEKWITSPPFEMNIDRFTESGTWPGNYRVYAVQLAWCAWEDAAKQENEACKQIAEAEALRVDKLNDTIAKDVGEGAIYLSGKAVAAARIATAIEARMK